MIWTLFDHWGSEIWKIASDEFWFWLKGFSSLAFVGTVFWFFTIRGEEGRSVKALVRYVFPKGFYSHPTMRPGYWNGLLSLAIWAPLIALLGGAKLGEHFATLLAHTFGPRGPLFHSGWVIVALELSVGLWGVGFFFYWLHYAFHKVPLLWSIHRVHHSSEALGITALLHTHPLEDVAFGPLLALPTAFVSGIMLYILGAQEFHPTVLAIFAFYGAWEGFHGIFEHSHIRISFGWFNRIYAGAALHQIHHSAELRHRDKNLGLHFAVIWDYIFGTIYIPEKNEQYRWGLNDQEYGENNPHLTVRDFYLEPFRYAWSVLKKKRTTEASSTISRPA